MPYIHKDYRPQYSEILNKLPLPQSKGELEYCIFYILKLYMENKKYDYSNLHETVYAGIHASEEFKRRYLDEREDFSLEINGDI